MFFFFKKSDVLTFSGFKQALIDVSTLRHELRSFVGSSKGQSAKSQDFLLYPWYHMKEVTTMNYSEILNLHTSLWVAPPWGIIIVYCNWYKNIKDQSYRYESYKGQVRKYDFLSGKWRSKGRNFSKAWIGVF